MKNSNLKYSDISALTPERMQSQTISWLRFPLIVAVVAIHTGLGDILAGNVVDATAAPWYYNFEWLVRDGIADVAVPLFFFFSGFLFFYRTDFTAAVYIDKLRKRFWSLLIPYLIWNMFTLCVRIVGETYAPSILPYTPSISDYSITDLVAALWANPYDSFLYPIAIQFWFIRDLMVCVVCSPVVFWLLRRTKIYSVVILCAFLYGIRFMGAELPPGVSVTSFFFFTFGAYFSVYKFNFASLCSKYLWLLGLLFLIGLGVRWHLWRTDSGLYEYASKPGIIAGVLLTIGLVARGIAAGRLRVVPFLLSGTFFIYAYHFVFMSIWNIIYLRLVYPCSELELFVGFIGIIAFTVCLGLGLYWLLNRLFPRFTAFICGGR